MVGEIGVWMQFAHILGVVVWVGGGAMLSLIGIRTRRANDPAALADFASLVSFAGIRVFMPAVLVVLVSGLWLVLERSRWNLGQPWVVLGLIAFFAAFLVGALFQSRAAMRLERVTGVTGVTPDVPAARAALTRWLTGYAVVLAILLFAIWDMVFKPGV